MDYMKYLEPSKYVVSLDQLDLALLPSTCTSRLKDSAPLWSTNGFSLNNNDFFEFKVNSRSDSKTLDIDEPKPKDIVTNHESSQPFPKQTFATLPKPKTKEVKPLLTTCHICDIEVPTAYLMDHEESLKHKAHVKIADAVLLRTRKHVLKKNIEYVQKDDNMYFCGPCASEIQVRNRRNHEKSKTHKQSVALDRLLYELVALYTDEEYGESNTVHDEAFDKGDDTKTKVDRNVDSNTVIISDIRARLAEYKTNTMENYIKLVNECDVYKLYSLSGVGDDVRISIEDDCEVIVAMDNFNGFMKIDDNFIMCLVCKLIVNNKEAHKTNATHIKNVTIPFKNQHCIRNLDNSSSHCVICNKIINNPDIHVLCDKTHLELLQKALVLRETVADKHNETENDINYFSEHIEINNDSNSNKYIETDNATKTNSTINTTNSNVDIVRAEDDLYICLKCNLKIHVNNINSHVNGTKHAMNSKSDAHYFMKQDVNPDMLVCRVCNVYVEDDASKVKEHVATSDHCHKYKNLLTANNVIPQKGDFYCKPCDVVLLKMNELYHIEKLTHVAKLDESKETQAEVLTVKQNNINETVGDDVKLPTKNPAYYCDVCNVYIPNNPYNISGHNDGARHMKNVLKLNQDVPDPIACTSTVEASSDVHYQMNATENEKNLMCKVCNCVVPNLENNITEHLKGKKHEGLLKNIVDGNHMESLGENYNCKVCNAHVKAQNLFVHINQIRHKKLTGYSEQNTESSETVKESNTDNNALINVETTESTDQLYLKFKHHFMELQDTRLQCKVCFDVDIPNTAQAVADHVKQTHLTGYKKLMSDNLIFETDEITYFCGVCVCLVPSKGEVHHVKGLRHTANHTSAVSEQNCKFCDIDTIGIANHSITSPEHIANVLRKQSLLHYCEFCKTLMQKNKVNEHADICHKLAVKDKICFCTKCDPSLQKKAHTFKDVVLLGSPVSRVA